MNKSDIAIGASVYVMANGGPLIEGEIVHIDRRGGGIYDGIEPTCDVSVIEDGERVLWKHVLLPSVSEIR